MFHSTDIDIQEMIDTTEAPGYKLNEAVLDRLLDLASFADSLAEEFDAQSIGWDVTPEKIDAVLWVKLDELVFLDGRAHPFFEKTKLADRVSFSKTADGRLQLTFYLMSLWIRQ